MLHVPPRLPALQGPLRHGHGPHLRPLRHSRLSHRRQLEEETQVVQQTRQ